VKKKRLKVKVVCNAIAVMICCGALKGLKEREARLNVAR